MDDDEVDAGQFEPIAQMRRLAVVLPKVLEPFDRIPVKLHLPEPLDPDLFSELLAEQADSIPKPESVKKEKDLLLLKAAKNDADKNETKEWEGNEEEKEEDRKKIRSSKKEIDGKETERKESERKESERKESEMKESENREPEKKALERKEEERNAREKKEFGKNELEKKEREKKTMKTKEYDTNVETDKDDYEERAHERKETIPKYRKDHLLSKEASGKQSYWSESETGSFSSMASQLSLRPGRNMRATPLSRASSRNTSVNNEPYVDLDSSKTYSRRARKVLPTEGSDSSYHNGQRKVKDKDRELVDQLVEGRKREDRREGHRYHIKSMINDVYRRKHNRIAASSSDLDHPSANRDFPTEPRPQSSTLSHRNIVRSGQANNNNNNNNMPKHHHHHHHRSKRSDAASHRHGNDDAGRRSADWVRSQRRVQSSNPMTLGFGGSDDVVSVIAIITDEFKRLGFL